ncbi:actin depolymerizing protein [Epithele typhae]|uniref:actin depolymerizing protein n=1 Tax=Epithele typhae TaxID=378194 RepID=UPI0020084BEA|nr:actin depolymerizing protein [Epithele typhae]KAH9945940.1 actin depolymerizing protein [Epithele typhae]
MSAPTGIAISPELASAFSDAVSSSNIRFLKISIQNETLVPNGAYPPSGRFEQDLDRLAEILEEDEPAYVLVRTDETQSDWLAVFYVPDNAKVRDKMVYAATRNTVTKGLGAAHFSDNIFATSKSDVTSEAYSKHRQHLAAPKPMSEREKEIEEVKAAEREAGGRNYEGSRARASHVGERISMEWTSEVEGAMKALGTSDDYHLVVLNINPATEAIQLTSASTIDISQLASSLPTSDPCLAYFAWPQSYTSPSSRLVVPIYSCPPSSAVRHRMLYSSAVLTVVKQVKDLLAAERSSSILAARKIETSDPAELDEAYLVSSLGLSDTTAAASALPATDGDKKPFARPKGPGRRR